MSKKCRHETIGVDKLGYLECDGCTKTEVGLAVDLRAQRDAAEQKAMALAKWCVGIIPGDDERDCEHCPLIDVLSDACPAWDCGGDFPSDVQCITAVLEWAVRDE
jgi:hypothetical protein